MRGKRAERGEYERYFVFAYIFKAGGVLSDNAHGFFRRLFGVFQKLDFAAETDDRRDDFRGGFRHDGKHHYEHRHQQIGQNADDGYRLRRGGQYVKTEYQTQDTQDDKAELLQQKTAYDHCGGGSRVYIVFCQKICREGLSARPEGRDVIVKFCDDGGFRRKKQAELLFETVKYQRGSQPVEYQNEQAGTNGQHQIQPVTADDG